MMKPFSEFIGIMFAIAAALAVTAWFTVLPAIGLLWCFGALK